MWLFGVYGVSGGWPSPGAAWLECRTLDVCVRTDWQQRRQNSLSLRRQARTRARARTDPDRYSINCTGGGGAHVLHEPKVKRPTPIPRNKILLRAERYVRSSLPVNPSPDFHRRSYSASAQTPLTPPALSEHRPRCTPPYIQTHARQ